MKKHRYLNLCLIAALFMSASQSFAADKKSQRSAITYDGPVAQPAPVDAKGGCGSRGGPGYRKANGQCASWRGK